MKIAYINAVYGVGSTGRSIRELRDFFINQGDEVYIASCTKIKEKNFYRIGNIIDYKVHALLSRVFSNQAGFSTFSTAQLIGWLKRIKPDVIQINNVHSNYINIYKLLNYTAKNNIPVVLVLDDCWFFTGGCCHYTHEKCYSWKQQCGHCRQLHKWNKSYFIDATKKNLLRKKGIYEKNKRLGVIGVSDWIAEEARESVLAGAKCIKRIYNSVDLKTFRCLPSPQRPDNLKDKKIILGVANYWDESKGLHWFNFLAERLDSTYQVVLIGNADKKKLHENIIQINRTESIDTLTEYYNYAHVFFQASIEESFGKVCAEALACGTPLVVFNSTASPELVQDGCGEIIEVDNREMLLKKIQEICKADKKLYQKKCRAFAESNFSLKNTLKEYKSFYLSL